MVLVVPVTHRWTRRAPTAPEDMREEPVGAAREPGSGSTRAILEAHLRSLGIAPEELDVALEYPSNEAVRAAVEAGSSVAVISRRVVEEALSAGTMALIAFPMPRRPFLALRHRERYATKAAQAFLDLLGSDGMPTA